MMIKHKPPAQPLNLSTSQPSDTGVPTTAANRRPTTWNNHPAPPTSFHGTGVQPTAATHSPTTRNPSNTTSHRSYSKHTTRNNTPSPPASQPFQGNTCNRTMQPAAPPHGKDCRSTQATLPISNGETQPHNTEPPSPSDLSALPRQQDASYATRSSSILPALPRQPSYATVTGG